VTAFVDTSAFYAVFDADDSNHRRAAEVWRQLVLEATSLLTNNYVLLETSALLQHRLGIEAIRAFHEDVTPLLRVEWIEESRHKAAAEAVLAAGKKRLSLVDCASFQGMRESGVRTVFCFDRHFHEQGFEVIP
jgi:predicted nucleic acid-binding protein